MAFAHSLHGNNPTYILHPVKSLPLQFNIAFNSPWTTYAYFVFKVSPSLSHGNSSSEHPLGKPLYPMLSIILFLFTIHAPTWVLGSLLLFPDKSATAIK